MNLITPIVVVPECSHCGSGNLRSHKTKHLCIDQRVRGHVLKQYKCNACGEITSIYIRSERAGAPQQQASGKTG